MFPQLKEKIKDALEKLQAQLVCRPLFTIPAIHPRLSIDNEPQEQDKGPGDQSTPEDITRAKEAVAAGMHALREVS